MITDSAILDAFFEECEDLLTALSEGLSDMRMGQTDSETVNAVFRAVHSIKGAAGAFSMDELVGFAHTFETVLDHVRSGQLTADEALLRVLQRAGDVLSDLVDDAREDRPAKRDKVDPVRSDLQAFLGDEAPAEEFGFEALSLDFGLVIAPVRFQVSFRPTPNFYTTGHDPLLLLRALAELGSTVVSCDRSSLPAKIEDFEVENGYIAWTIEIDGPTSDLPIREIFEFVDDLCALEIIEIEPPATDNVTEPEAPDDEPQSVPANLDIPSAPEQAQPATPLVQKDRAGKKSATTLRVDPERVDRLINAVGELIINQSVISQRIQQAALPSSSDLFSDLDDYKLLAREIQEGVMAIRAQPVKPLFQRMLRIAREAAEATGKNIDVITVGEAIITPIRLERLRAIVLSGATVSVGLSSHNSSSSMQLFDQAADSTQR